MDRHPLHGLPRSLALLCLAPTLLGSAVPSGDVVSEGASCGATLCVGDTAAGSLTLDGAACNETYDSVMLGNLPTGVGDLFIRNGASWSAAQGLGVGRRGIGFAEFESGAQVTLGSGISLGIGDLFDPSGAGARGDLEIRGGATSVSSTSLLVGIRNPGSATVEGGATFATGSILLGGADGAGDLAVSGHGTQVTASILTRVGDETAGTLLVEDGGRLETAGFDHDCCASATTITGVDASMVPSRLVVNGALTLAGDADTFEVLAGAEVTAQSFAPTGADVDVTISGADSLLEITGGAASVWGDAFAPGDESIQITVADGGELLFSDPGVQVFLSQGFGTSSIVFVQSGGRFEAATIQLGSAGASFDDASRISLSDGTVAASDEIVLDVGSVNGSLSSFGDDVIDGDVRYVNGDTSIAQSLQVTGSVELGNGDIEVGNAAYEVLGDFSQTHALGTLFVGSAADVHVGGVFEQDAGTIEADFRATPSTAPIAVDGAVAIHDTIHVRLDFQPDGTRLPLVESGVGVVFDGTVTFEGLGPSQPGVVASVVGNTLELVVPEPPGAVAGFAALAALAALARRRSATWPRAGPPRGAGARIRSGDARDTPLLR